jgi:hypothetical protein
MTPEPRRLVEALRRIEREGAYPADPLPARQYPWIMPLTVGGGRVSGGCANARA